jgi:autotransporter-associated beta strand protein
MPAQLRRNVRVLLGTKLYPKVLALPPVFVVKLWFLRSRHFRGRGMKLKSAFTLFVVLGVIGWGLPVRAQDGGVVEYNESPYGLFGDGSSSATGTVTVTSLVGANWLTNPTTINSGGVTSGGTLNLSGLNSYLGGQIGTLNNIGATINVDNYSVTNTLDAGTGTLIVSGANSYTGPTIVNGGSLQSNNINLNGTANTTSATVNTGSVTLSGGLTSLSTGSTLTVGALNASSGTINLAIGANLSGTITGSTTAILNTGTLKIGSNPIISSLLTPPSATLSGTTYVFPPQVFTGTLNFVSLPASSYHATDLGNLSDWLATESGESSAVINSVLSSGLHVAFTLPGYISLSPSLQNLESLSNSLDSSGTGWTLTQGYEINTAGDFVVGATASDGTSHALLLSPVPEPASAVLAGFGLATLVFFVRRRAPLWARG